MKRIAILGSTGSIGTQALDVVSQRPEEFSVEALTCGSNIQRFHEQLKIYSPKLAVTGKEEDAKVLKEEFPHIDFLYGMDGIILGLVVSIGVLAVTVYKFRQPEKTAEAQVV